MTATVDVDWAPVTKAVAQLTDGVESGSRRAALEQATATAGEIRSAVPVLTGRLAASVGVIPEGDGAAVTYGGGLPYARKIERRTHAVADAVADAPARFAAAETAMAEREVSRL